MSDVFGKIMAAAMSADVDAPIYGISRETYRMLKAHAGNAKARRRWRRRNVPNTQRADALIAEAEALRVSPGGGDGVTLAAANPGRPGDVLP